MERPGDLFDRDREWSDLLGFATGAGPGVRVALLYGRRRQGKSFLLRRLVSVTGGFYHQALEEERAQALDRFAADWGTASGSLAGCASATGSRP